VTGEFAFLSADCFFKKFQDLERLQKSTAAPTDHLELLNSSGSSQESKDHRQLEEFRSRHDLGLQYPLIHELASKKLMLHVQVVVKLANQIALKRVVVQVLMLRDACEEFLEARQC
jgi:hypothetical protein